MPDGAPPPWLINMQRYGPPPSYPRMKIPGVNAPIPPGASYGFHAGGWGRPPIDDQGNPLYGGDLFGTADEQVVRIVDVCLVRIDSEDALSSSFFFLRVLIMIYSIVAF